MIILFYIIFQMTTNPTLFDGKTIRHAVARNVAFLQCSKYFHIVTISEVQGESHDINNSAHAKKTFMDSF